ncbi:MAG: helix-turn-helix domain-containing protein [Chloroflexota bacterium]|nr:helix-turn-helix domain-containing protein [Chloroflexota bacterium]
MPLPLIPRPGEARPLERLLTEKDVARIIGVSQRTLQNWRQRKEGPNFVRVSSCIRYRPSDIALYIARLTGELK